ncbi:hypothetical protein AcV5_008378 [Taiwanofungus camphoratus]|nr:hypothetical protein AcV5_008378 [Antrodia cinnamomea]
MVDLTDSRGPYNLPPADPAVDELTYNPQADARIDNAEFDPEKTDPETQPVGARGAENEPTNRDAAREDAEAARSEETGEIPESEVEDILEDETDEERNMGGAKTRGKREDAWKQDRDLDKLFDETGVSSVGKEIEVTNATG